MPLTSNTTDDKPSSTNTTRSKRSNSSASQDSSQTPKSQKITAFFDKGSEDEPPVLGRMKAFPGQDLNIRKSGSMNRLPLKNHVKRVVIQNATSSNNEHAMRRKQEYYEQSSLKLNNAVDAILAQEPTEYPYEYLYKCVENLCRDQRAEELWRLCLTKLKNHVKTVVLTAIKTEPDGLGTIRKLVHEKNTWDLKVKLIRDIYFYLDRDYLLHRSSRQPIWETGILLFSKYVVNDDAVYPKLANGLTRLMNASREGQYDATGKSNLQQMSRIMTSYYSDSKQLMNLVVDTAAQYCTDCITVNVQNTLDYLDAIELQVARETELCETTLSLGQETTRAAVVKVKSCMLVESRYVPLFTDGMAELVRDQNMDAINFLLSTADSIDLGDEMCKYWGEFVSAQVEQVAKQQVKRPYQAIPELIILYRKCFNVSENALLVNARFRTTFESQLKAAMDRHGEYIAEGLAKFVDQLMRKNDKSSSNAEHDSEVVVELLQYLGAKQTFIKHFERDFARRLLQEKTVGVEEEAAFVSRLKNMFGAKFTESAETMVKDVKTSNTEMESMRQALQDAHLNLDFNMSILSDRGWPSFQTVNVPLPRRMSEAMQKFEELYSQKHPKRCVRWQHWLGSCKIKARFDTGNKELNVNQLQAIILDLFNAQETLTFGQIVEALAIDHANANANSSSNTKEDGGDAIVLVKQALLSLSCGKVKILLKTPMKGLAIDKDTEFGVNVGLSHPAYRIKIATLPMPNQDQERRQQVQREVVRDRSLEIQAAAARIMKARKELSHVQLVQQILDQIKHRGAVPISEVKKGIESLIEREFLIRDASNPAQDMYRYNNN